MVHDEGEEIKLFIVWVGPSDEIAVDTTRFKTANEKDAYVQGIRDSSGWDHGLVFSDLHSAAKYAEERKTEAELDRARRLTGKKP